MYKPDFVQPLHIDVRQAGLPPVIDERCKILIVGSFPSKISLAQNEYYANPRNDFWRLITRVLNMPQNISYPVRIQFLLDHHIGLWDVIGSCQRTGSSDTAIRNSISSDIPSLLNQYPKIIAIVANGRKAESGLMKVMKEMDRSTSVHIQQIYLPSSSPAHAIRIEEKTDAWMVLQALIQKE